MHYTKIVHKIKKICLIGPKESCRIAHNRINIARFKKKHKANALKKKAGHHWRNIKSPVAFNQFLHRIKQQKTVFLNRPFDHTIKDNLIKNADEIASNQWPLFSQTITFEGTNRWHRDFILKTPDQHNSYFDPNAFFADIKITAGQSKQCSKDIRNVWEINRLQTLPQLSIAYKETSNSKYLNYFISIFNDWRTHNPYLLGPNWLCPMEVAIRGINLIVAFNYFKHTNINDSFWKSYICTLYDHMHFIQHNWEYYDGRTNNHYLSNLVGYFYLNWFFQDLPHADNNHQRTYTEILRELKKQILPDGTSYEGSTAYHRLVTELVYLTYLLCKHTASTATSNILEDLTRMCSFMDTCMIDKKQLITIGDNDSGNVLWCGLPASIIDTFKIKQTATDVTHYEHFGLTILKNKSWHISLRHHAYQPKQPSGHFHNDAGNLTLAINNIPVLIDPGSFCYTALSAMRNAFRSAKSHNMPYITQHEPVPLDNQLFTLNIRKNAITLPKLNTSTIETSHAMYQEFGVSLSRKATLKTRSLAIVDHIKVRKDMPNHVSLSYNFIFAPNIKLTKEHDFWVGYFKAKKMFHLKAPCHFELKTAWASSSYGQKIKTISLCATIKITHDKELHFLFTQSQQ